VGVTVATIALALVGAGLLIAGLAVIYWPAGLIVAGALALLAGLFMETS
jgi:hypothetical protein